jgi:hypothetical protein
MDYYRFCTQHRIFRCIHTYTYEQQRRLTRYILITPNAYQPNLFNLLIPNNESLELLLPCYESTYKSSWRVLTDPIKKEQTIWSKHEEEWILRYHL